MAVKKITFVPQSTWKRELFMRKLALPDEILPSIQQPARYIGGEANMCVKDPQSVDVRFAMCFPDVYEIGMSHLGIQILYDMFNQREDVYCERIYSPWTDLDKIMREKQIPLLLLRRRSQLKTWILLVSPLQYREMCYTNILQILDLGQIPLLSKDRSETDPLIIGGGPVLITQSHWQIFLICFILEKGSSVF